MIDNIEMRICREFQCEITIHMDPVVTDDREVNEAKEMVKEIVSSLDASWSIHDFRMVRGQTHTNLIFDVVVPVTALKEKGEIASKIREKISQKDKKYFAVIQVEQAYA